MSIGYSTCHWCHVMAHESFENADIAAILNSFFISVKVDREERPDIDSVYMRACQAMTGSGGWPASLFLSPQGKPFYAGTYFPPKSMRGMTGFYDLLLIIADKWANEREELSEAAEKIAGYLESDVENMSGDLSGVFSSEREDLIAGLKIKAFEEFKATFDERCGGFGSAPKFPTPHNLIFLLLFGDKKAAEMAEKTLVQMRKGGLFDHIGGGFSRYSTDREYLVPHFEKMLYDNALLLCAYSFAYNLCGGEIYLDTAKRTAAYLMNEMRSAGGGFFSAQDADSEGGEGLFYVFSRDEIFSVLGEDRGGKFAEYFGITAEGNFEGRSIPNRLHGEIEVPDGFEEEREALYRYRKERMGLALDDKILTAWNSLAIIGFCALYRACGDGIYLDTAVSAAEYIKENLSRGGVLFVSEREGKLSGKGFLEDYAFFSAALLALYGACGNAAYLEDAEFFAESAVRQFYDKNGGFFQSGTENERLFLSHKETYDGAIPSGNSVMYFVLEKLSALGRNKIPSEIAETHAAYLCASAKYPSGVCAFLASALFLEKQTSITAVLATCDSAPEIIRKLPIHADIRILQDQTADFPLKNNKTTYYICENKVCHAPVNDISENLPHTRANL